MNAREATIVIADDTASNVALLRATLAAAGYSNLVTTMDSAEVNDLCSRRDPDLLLLDLHMPDPGGLEILATLDRDDRSWFPVVVLTADASSEARQAALSAGATDFLTKPFDRVEMLQRIENMLSLRHAQRRLAHQNEELEAAVAARTADLEEARLEVLERLALAGEFRDDATGRHTDHVGRIARAIAIEMSIPRTRAELIRQAATLHDIGKIGIPDSILLKPGALSPEEFHLMKEHTTIGAQILSDSHSPLLQLAESVALCHHERWDGRGYPRGLSGEEIPLPARITAVADIFDALTSRRPYREPWSFERAIAEIDSLSGAHLDPRVVNAFSQVVGELMVALTDTHGETATEKRVRAPAIGDSTPAQKTSPTS